MVNFMTAFDYLVLFILISSIIISTMRGLLKEILSLLGWIIAFLVANAYAVMLAKLIPVSIPYSSQSLRLIIAFVVLFIGTRLLVSLLIMAMDSIVTATGLKLIDRSLGSLFGLARGGIIVLALMLGAGMTNLPQQPFWKEAMLRPMAEATALTLKPFLPGSFAQYVRF